MGPTDDGRTLRAAEARLKAASTPAEEALALHELAVGHQELGDFEASVRYATRAVVAWEALPGSSSRVAQALRTLANAHMRYPEGSLGEAHRAILRAIALLETGGQEVDRDNLEAAYLTFASLNLQAREPEGAFQLFRRVVLALMGRQPRDAGHAAWLRVNLAEALAGCAQATGALGQLEAARAWFETCAAFLENHFAESDAYRVSRLEQVAQGLAQLDEDVASPRH